MKSKGVLPPQLPHHFQVYFRAERTREVDEEANVDAALALVERMDNLSGQLTMVTLPELLLGGYAVKPRPGAFNIRRHTGNIKFVFQEDITGLLSSAIEGVTDGSVQWFGATACKLDGNGNVLEAFDLSGLKFLSVQYSPLSYYSKGSSIHGTIADAKGYPLSTGKVSLSFVDGTDKCSTQIITASVNAILTARYPGGRAIKDVLGDL